MRFLFNVWSRASHLNGPMSLGKQLADDGHTVGYYCHDGAEKVRSRLDCMDLPASCLTWDPTASAVREAAAAESRPVGPPASHFLQLGRRLQDDNWRQKYFERLFVHSAPGQIEPIRRVIRTFEPDVFCTEAVSYAGAIAAELEGVRWATLASSWGLAVPPDYDDPFARSLKQLDPLRRELARRAGVEMEFLWTQVVSPHLNLTFGWEELTPRTSLTPKYTHFIGGIPTPPQPHVPFPWDRLLPGRPLIYISSGTEFEFEPVVARVLVHAATAAGAQVVFVSQRSPVPAGVRNPERIIHAAYVPQQELLERASLLVTAGGCSSIIDGIAAGVPLVVVPIGHDQPFNGRPAEQAGIGRIMRSAPVDTEDAERWITHLLRPDAPERARIASLRSGIMGRDPQRDGSALLKNIGVGLSNRARPAPQRSMAANMMPLAGATPTQVPSKGFPT